tara:strand:- start:1690 stop:2175 length:486 start_codon:yes stop_codon:yes gene_type:complete
MKNPKSGSSIPSLSLAEDKHVAVIASLFNEKITAKLVDRCQDTLVEFGVLIEHIDVYWVPGAWELPQTSLKVASLYPYDSVITLGCVIRGETAHFDHISNEASQGLGAVARMLDSPLLFGVLTTDTYEQALARASREGHDKGREIALSAIHMMALYDDMED